MGIINAAVARRVARLMAEREAALGFRLEIASVELPQDGGDLIVKFRRWNSARHPEGEPA